MGKRKKGHPLSFIPGLGGFGESAKKGGKIDGLYHKEAWPVGHRFL
jgi:hypothetical protein